MKKINRLEIIILLRQLNVDELRASLQFIILDDMLPMDAIKRSQELLHWTSSQGEER